MPSKVLSVVGGGTAEILETDGQRVVIGSSVPSPPGSTYAAVADDPERPLKVKVRGCQRALEGERPFRIEGRFVDITREQRAALTASPDRR
jgi:hypothetical protein